MLAVVYLKRRSILVVAELVVRIRAPCVAYTFVIYTSGVEASTSDVDTERVFEGSYETRSLLIPIRSMP